MTLQKIPDIVSGYALDKPGSFWKIVRACASTNLITNPSFETATTGYTITATSSSRSSELSARGFYSLKATAAASSRIIISYAITLTAAGAHSWSFDLYAKSGTTFTAIVVPSASTTTKYAHKTFTVKRTGWTRYAVQGYLPAAAIRLQLYVSGTASTNYAPVGSIYTDGWQLEALPYATSYVDGDVRGFETNPSMTEYWWNGTPHASTSSRSGFTRHGGEEVALDDFHTMSMVQTSIPPMVHRVTRYTSGASIYDGVTEDTREFSLVGATVGVTFQELMAIRRELTSLVGPFNDQPLKVVFDDGTHEEVEIDCYYSAGLEGAIDNFYQERLTMTFRSVGSPYWQSRVFSGAHTFANIPARSTACVFERDNTGNWSALGSGTTGTNQIWSVCYTQDGSVVAVGDFTTIHGVSANRAAIWNGSAWSQYSGGLASAAYWVDQGRGALSGKMIVCGAFTNKLVSADGASFSAIFSTAIVSGNVKKFVVMSNGDIYFIGDMKVAGGGAFQYNGVGRVANDGTESDLSDGFADPGGGLTMYDIIVGRDNKIYVVGNFTATTGGAFIDSCARWNTKTSEWELAGDLDAISLLNNGRNFFVGNDGALYYSDEDYLKRFNGYQWRPVGKKTGVYGTDENGVAYCDPQTGESGVYGYNVNTHGASSRFYATTATFVGADVSEYAGNDLVCVRPGYNGKVVAAVTKNGTSGYGTYGYGRTNEITYSGSARAGMVLRLNNSGASTVYTMDLENTLSGKHLFLDLALGEDDTVLVDTDRRGFLSMVANGVDDVRDKLVPGISDSASFFLERGTNPIKLVCVNGSASLSVMARWRNSYLGLEDVIGV